MERINPFVRYLRMQTAAPDQSRFAGCYDCRLFYFFAGNGSLRFPNGEKYDLTEGSAVFLPAGTRYALKFSAQTELRFVVANFDLLPVRTELEESLGTPLGDDFDPSRVIVTDTGGILTSPIIRQSAACAPWLSRCADLFITASGYYREQASAWIKLCLFELLRESDRETRYRNPIAARAADYLRAHYGEPELTDRSLSEALGYHPYYLSRVFKAATGKTVRQYLIDYRVRIAKNRLLSTDDSVETVAWRCGFNSVSYFIQTFKKRTGTSPARYRVNEGT